MMGARRGALYFVRLLCGAAGLLWRPFVQIDENADPTFLIGGDLLRRAMRHGILAGRRSERSQSARGGRARCRQSSAPFPAGKRW